MSNSSRISKQAVQSDLDILMWSSGLATLLRFHKQPFWEKEGEAADQAHTIEGDIRLESVADHSWKVADAVLLLADHFPWLDRGRALELAVVHDKLELFTGDLSPIDGDASGLSTHAFNQDMAAAKAHGEHDALADYLQRLRPAQRSFHRQLYLELIDVTSEEARFICALDKLAALLYVIQKKPEGLSQRHYDFTVKYSGKCVEYFPAIAPHYQGLIHLLKVCE